MILRSTFLTLLISLGMGCTSVSPEKKPNIIVILTDDLGYGDLTCYSSEAKVKTPNLDRLATEGALFTDAHSPSTVCTPSRYGVMTGHMPFRLNYRGVFTGVGGPCLIKEDRLTIADMLRQNSYSTAMIGKWHIGMTFFDSEGNPINESGSKPVKRVDFSRKIKGTPIDYGFDYFYGTVCCPTTDFLYAYIENDRIPVPPTKWLDKSKLPKHPYSKDCRSGRVAPDFDHEEVDNLFLKKSIKFLKEHAEKSPDKPFFLFHSTQAVHLPSFAGKDFRGKSGVGPHGDFIHQLDDNVGELMAALKKYGFDDNTLVILSSDNGPEVPTVIAMREDHQHDGAHPWRGMKRDNWEGGHRVPMLAWWPGKIKPATVSKQTLCLTDIMATVAEVIGEKLPENAAEDSFSFVPALLGTDGDKPIRPYTLHQTISLKLAIRRGKWKYLDHKGSGGNDYERIKYWDMSKYILPEKAPDAPGQLYNLEEDPGETNNLYFKHPEVVKELKALLAKSKKEGRSRPK